MRRALIIEDDTSIAQLVQMHLADVQCEAEIEPNGAAGLARLQKQRYDLLVLDLMLPGLDGLSVCREVRKLSGYVPILMLTAKSTELDRVVGLEMGADDYLTKPFSIPELLARVKALFRRVDALAGPSSASAGELMHCGAIQIDTGRRRVEVAGREVSLTAKEFDLLAHFARHPGRVFSRVQLLDQVWGYHHSGYEHTVNSHINRLRAKVEVNPAKPEYVLTVWGVGYKFRES